MTADVNVTEKVAKRLFASPVSNQAARTAPEIMALCDEAAREALSALADPEVQAGIAGVVREHRMAWSTYTRRVVCRGCDVMATGVSEQEEARQIEERHQADAVREWLRGRA